MNNISPEEILRMKEEASGFLYDDPVDQYSNQIMETYVKNTTEQTTEPDTSVEPDIEIDPSIIKKSSVAQDFSGVKTQTVFESEPAYKPEFRDPDIRSFGKAQSAAQSPSFDTGWKNLPVAILPSSGIFYPDGTKMAIRSAEVREIRHFSTIDDDDRLDIDEKLSYVLERCLRIDFPGEGVVSYKDLKQEDRFFIILAIRDLTFTKGENSIILKPRKMCKDDAECPIKEGIELRTGVLNRYDLDPKILKYYNHSTRTFIFDIKKIGKRVEMSVPSIGVNKKIADFLVYCEANGIYVDEGFLKIAPFLFSEWRNINNDDIHLRMRESDYWSKEEYSVYFELSEKIKIGTVLEVKVKCPNCAGEVTADIAFPSGLRSLFVISDIFGELL
jgi:hypothetical protein